MQKTNVMRLLEQKKINFKPYDYSKTDAISGIDVAKVLNENVEKVFKTLVTVGKSREHYVFVIPVAQTLNLSKAAKIVGEKKVEMIPQKELIKLTGYIHGGCSPIGMKKQFVTVLDKSIEKLDMIYISAGKIGYQVKLAPIDLKKIINFKMADITK